MKNNLEKEGVNFLEKIFLNTKRIDPHISTDDKYPIWDGDIILYKDEDLINRNIIRRIPVQVKTRKLKKQVRSFKLDEVELNNFIKEGGVLYFVIQIIDGKFVPTYCELTKFECNKYLKQCKNNKISIDLQEFPQNSTDVLICIERFAIEMGKQIIIDPNITSIDSGLEKYWNKKLKFNLKVPLDRNEEQIIEQFYKQKPYIYCEDEKGIQIPIGRVNDNFIFTTYELIDVNVKLNGEILFKSLINQKTRNGDIVVLFGKDISLNLTKNKLTYRLNSKKKLNDKISDLKFLNALWSKQLLTIGQNDSPIVLELDRNGEEEKKIEANLEFCIKLSRIQDFFCIEKEIDLSLCNDENAKKNYAII